MILHGSTPGRRNAGLATVGGRLIPCWLIALGFPACFGMPCLRAQTPGPVATLTQQYEEARKRAMAPGEEQGKKIGEAYLTQLTVLEREYSAKGALDPVLELQKEREVFEKTGETGGGSLDALRVIREKLQRDLAANEAMIARAVAGLDDVYRTRLGQIQVELTKAGNIEEAKAAKAILDGLAADSTPTLAAPSSGTKRAPWSAPPPSDASVLEGGLFLEPVTLPQGTHRLRNKISIGVRKPTPRFNDIYLLEGTKISCAEGGEIFLTLGKGNAFGVVFESAYVTGGLDADWRFINCAFDDTRFAKGDGWAAKHQASMWAFENCSVRGSFFPTWNTQDVGYNVESTTFKDVKFPDLEYRAEAGTLAQTATLLMKSCRFQSCELPLSVLITTENCVFEQCTFRDDASPIPITSSLSVKVYSSGGANRLQAPYPQLKLEIRDLKEFRGQAGAMDR